MLAALQYLKNNNPEYSDININENWINTWQELDKDVYDAIFDIDEDEEIDDINTADQDQISHKSNENDCGDVDQSHTQDTHYNSNNTEDEEDMIAIEENCKLRDLPYDTCLQSELPEVANQIFSIAPGEGNKPIPLSTDKLFEEFSNPDKFPSGKGGYTDTERVTRLTLRKYVNAQLLDQDGRFARDVEYIFSMQLNISKLEILSTLLCDKQEVDDSLVEI